jgi:hypothetical protein
MIAFYFNIYTSLKFLVARVHTDNYHKERDINEFTAKNTVAGKTHFKAVPSYQHLVCCVFDLSD